VRVRNGKGNSAALPFTGARAVPIPEPKIKREKRILQADVPSPLNPLLGRAVISESRTSLT